MLVDMHLHTRLSSDADQRDDNCVMFFCEDAVRLGLRHIAFTEHRDILEVSGTINCDMQMAKTQVDEAKAHFEGTLDVMFGIELAHAHVFKPQAACILDECRPDFVLGSLHNLSDGFDFYGMDCNEYGDDELRRLYDRYLAELLMISRECDFDSLAHCAYPLRYYRRAGRGNVVKISNLYEAYTEIFRTLIERGKCLEVNSSSYLEKDFAQPVPHTELVELYVKLGGRRFTVGSDSHDRVLLGHHTDMALGLIKSLGIDEVFTYHERKPMPIKI